MIPKIIHYCWLSNDPIPENLRKCMSTWEKYLPEYEFMLWNFERFPKSKSKWVSDAYDNKKYAFAADYIRLYALYNYGGIYLDMDVEVCKSFNPMLNLKTMLCWQNGAPGLEVAAMGVEKGSKWIKECLEYYDCNQFILSNGQLNTKVMPQVIEDYLRAHNIDIVDIVDIDNALNIKCGLPVFPCDYFSPKNYMTHKLNITDNTYCIHHFDGSWVSKGDKFKQKVINFIGPSLTQVCVKIKQTVKKMR